MNARSELINELAEALSKAQAEIQDAEKNAKNLHFKSSYADLSAVLQATREPLSKNGLSVSQITFSIEDDYFIETILLHKSGQFLSSRLKLLLIKKDMQGLGSSITYARRYCLAAIVGIAQEDNDANPVVSKFVQKTPSYSTKQKDVMTHVEEIPSKEKEEIKKELESDKEREFLLVNIFELVRNELKFSNDQIKVLIYRNFQKQSSQELSIDELKKLKNILQLEAKHKQESEQAFLETLSNN